MNVEINVTKSFKRAARPLIKRYRSFLDDLAGLESELVANPRLGTSLGGNIFKIRLKIASKGKGKSSGARVISLLQYCEKRERGNEEITIVNLLTVYDKSEQGNITDSELRSLVAGLEEGSVDL